MKANLKQIVKALDAPAGHRLFLLYGPDESGSRELAQRVANAMGADAEAIDLTGAALKADPARLADEAAAFSLFGGARHIRVEPAGDEAADAVAALLESPSTGAPVVIVASALRKDAKLLKLALADKNALVFASYAPEGADADRLAVDMARARNLILAPDVAQRLAEAANGDRAVLGQELDKYASFTDAVPGKPATIDHAMIDALGAGSGEADMNMLVDAVASGNPALVASELARLGAESVEGITLIRAVLRRMLLLAQLRAGGGPGYGKDNDAARGQLGRWSADTIARAIERLGESERAIKAPGSIGPLLADTEFVTLSRAANRRR